ncbi:sperm flagellar protein 2-like [Harmonia axyridis]|uniref:sperm flagellar protein 2-like n=1 Tax=Harmonia axyridis TaxID=115357 RepID=UPI001E27956E|nr:sperm flagellar protein 2-like [Harmonia axyridis]
MLKIIQEWLMDSLGLIVDLKKIDFGKRVKDGYLIGQVLCGFEVISREELCLIKPTEDREVAMSNFMNYVLIWLGKLDIRLKDVELDDLLDGKERVAINLFYELYLALQNKSKLHMITQKRVIEKSKQPHPKFEVKKVKESKLDDLTLELNPHCYPLIENRDIIRWHKDILHSLTKQCEEARREYLLYFNTRRNERPPTLICTCDLQCVCPKNEIKKDHIDYPEEASQDFTYDELVAQRRKSRDVKKHEPNLEEAKQTVRKLKTRRFENKEKEIQKMRLHTELCEEFWNEMVKHQEKEIEELVDDKITAQSFYEKQMINKLFQVKHQQEVIKENRSFVNEEIMKQNEEDTLQKIYMEQRLSDECVCDYLYERERIKELHRRVYAEKLRLKKSRIEKICKETAEDLVNLAIRVAEFKEDNKDEPTRRRYDDWVSLFIKGGSILPKVVPTEDIVQDLSDLPEEEEPAFIEEITRQEIIDSKDFEKYHKSEWPWEPTNLGEIKFNFKLIERGMNIIGYIVHRLLLAKYPSTPLMPKPDFKFEYSVCINGLTDTTIPGKLQSLLSYKDIEVFEVLDAVNYCLDRFAQEQKPEENEDLQSIDVEEMEDKMKTSAVKLAKGKKGKLSKDVDKSKSGLSVNQSTQIVVPPVMNKKHQTPQIYPCEEVKMSHAATLGEIAQNSMNLGEPLTDYLVAAMIVEYLYSVSDKKGWALINYPTSYNQAVTLEENISSTPLCKDSSAIKSIMDLSDLEEKPLEGLMRKERDPKRYSKLFARPPKLRDDDAYDTVLTAYIKIIKTKLDSVEEAESNLPPITKYIDESADALEKFYAEQGCAYFMFYESFDYNTVKYLARLVIGDYSLPRKSSVELFGRSVLLGEEEVEDDVGIRYPKSSKEISIKEKDKKKLYLQKETDEDTTTKEKKGKPSKQGKSSEALLAMTWEHKSVQVPPLEDIFEIIIEEEDLDILPGEEKWKYLEIPMSEELQLILAKMCENMENLYIEDFKQVLFMRRLVLNNIQPYISHTKSHLMEFLQRPDDRQEILHEFQMTFNEISECLRSDDEVKAELHCRADELRKALQATSERNIMESFGEREKIIEMHWLRKELHELMQIYLCGMQLELDRFVDTIQLLTDYYVCGITNMPPEETPFAKELIRSLESDSVQNYESFSMWEDAFDTRYFNEKMLAKVTKSLEFIEKTKSSAHKIVGNTQGKFALGKPKPEKQKGKGAPSIQMSDIVRDNMDKLVEEWKTAIEAESERVTFRLRLLKCDSEHCFREMSSKVKDMMNEIYGHIRIRYNNEQSSIEQLCDVIANAVENETPIQIELLIDRDQFFVHPEILLFPDDLPPPPLPVKEWKRESVFTIEQLKNLHRVLQDLAPSGTIPERQFTFLLQDMLVHDVEDGKEPLAPEMWRMLTTIELEKVVNELFSKSECIHWKDFIIYNLMIAMPSSEQLLELKREFQKKDKGNTENISVQDFNAFRFWFEECFCKKDESDMMRLLLMKELVCDLYRVNEHTVNYSAMLVDFCKDHIGAVGFAKLLGIILDRPVCWDANIGKKYVQYQILRREAHEKKVQARDEEIRDDKKMARDFLGEIADETVHQCDSVIITDAPETPNSMEILSIEGETCGDQCLCDMRCYCGDKPEETFSNISIDFEESFDPSLVYFLDFEPILAAEAVVLQWYTQVQNIDGKSFRQRAEEIYNECKNPDFNNSVLAHEFLNHYKFSQLLANTTRFTDKYPSNFLQHLIKFRK